MSKSAPYFPFYADDWLDNENIFDMGLECEGAYIRLLAAMWKRDGYITDSERMCCNILRCKPAKWRKIKETLIGFGVIQLKDGRIFNERLTKELNFFKEKSEKNSENANKRWNKFVETEGEKPNEINESDNTNASQPQCHTDTDTDTDTYKPIDTNVSIVGKAKAIADCPHQEIIKLYSEKLPTGIVPQSWGSARASALKARWREKDQRQDIEWWRLFFEYISKSDFLTGKVETPGRKPFEINLPWILKKQNFDKIIDGIYH